MEAAGGKIQKEGKKMMTNQTEIEAYAWCHFGPETQDRLVIDVLSCFDCLTSDEKEKSCGADLVDFDLDDDEKYFCDRCKKPLN